MALGVQAGTNIGTLEPSLLAARLPELHLSGSTEDVVKSLARRAGVKARRLGPQAWQLVRLAPPRKPAVVPPTQTQAVTAIIVEGAKRTQGLLDDPADVIRISGKDLDRYGRTPDTRAIADLVPTLASTDWGAGHDKLFLRGVADSSFLGASPSLVGQYWGDQRLNYSAPDPDLRLYDVASVEVMEGPQGTLYGAGALGGLVRIEPRAPVLNALTGAAWSGITATAHGGSGPDAGAVVNVPLVEDRLALRLVGYTALEPGYIDDLGQQRRNVNRVRTRGGRAALRWAPAADWTIDLLGVGQSIDTRDAPYADEGALPLTRSSSIAQPSYNQFLSGGLIVSGRLAGSALRSTTGIVHQSFGERFEVLQPFYSLLFVGENKSTLISQETRLSGATPGTNWVAGFSALWNLDRERSQYGFVGNPSPLADLHNRTRDLTGYGEITRHLIEHVSATVGVRYSSVGLVGRAAKLSRPFFAFFTPPYAPPVQASRSEHHLVPSVALSYKLGAQAILFIHFERGFRPGGLTAGATVKRFSGDRIGTTEAGIRWGVAGQDRWAFSLVGATSRWKNIQADQIDGLGLPYITNIGDGRVRSIDAMASLRFAPDWQLDISGFVARGRFNPAAALADDGGARELPNVVRDGGSASLDYRGHLAGEPWRAELRLRHVGKSLFGTDPILAQPQGGYTTLELGGDIRLRAVDFTLNMTNLTDSAANAFAVGTPFAGVVRKQITPLRPRTLRLGARYDF